MRCDKPISFKVDQTAGRRSLRAAPKAPVASRANTLAAVALIQVGLGVATLLSLVPIDHVAEERTTAPVPWRILPAAPTPAYWCFPAHRS
jgi:hypothetical protein